MTDHDLQRRAARLVSQNVLCCVSGLVAELAQGYGHFDAAYYSAKGGPLRDSGLGGLFETAATLAAPIPDYESAADEAGFTRTGDGMCIDLANDLHANAEVACDHHGIEPHHCEVFEHWAVTDWLADKLEAKGEKVDRDFAGLTVWARTTTGQAISIDSVIEEITTETGFASGGEA